jgi:hypothetical protein
MVTARQAGARSNHSVQEQAAGGAHEVGDEHASEDEEGVEEGLADREERVLHLPDPQPVLVQHARQQRLLHAQPLRARLERQAGIVKGYVLEARLRARSALSLKGNR